MKKNYSLTTPPHAATINAWDFLFLKNKTSLVFALLFTFLGFSNNLYSQIAQRGGAENATANTVTTLTINKPTGVVTGDIMIVNIACDDNNTINNATLAG